MKIVFTWRNPKHFDCWEVKPCWMLLGAKPTSNQLYKGSNMPICHKGRFRLVINQTALPHEDLYTSPTMKQTPDHALRQTLGLALEDFEIRAFGEPACSYGMRQFCFSLKIFSISDTFLTDLLKVLQGDNDEDAFGFFGAQVRKISNLRRFVDAEGVLLSQAELRQIGRAIDPIDEFQAIRD